MEREGHSPSMYSLSTYHTHHVQHTFHPLLRQVHEAATLAATGGISEIIAVRMCHMRVVDFYLRTDQREPMHMIARLLLRTGESWFVKHTVPQLPRYAVDYALQTDTPTYDALKLDTLKWLVEREYRLDFAKVSYMAGINNDSSTLIWLECIALIDNKMAVRGAIRGGHDQLAKEYFVRAYERGTIPLHQLYYAAHLYRVDAMSVAAECGNVSIFEWIREKAAMCPASDTSPIGRFNDLTPVYYECAMQGNSVEMLRHLRNIGCDYNRTKLMIWVLGMRRSRTEDEIAVDDFVRSFV